MKKLFPIFFIALMLLGTVAFFTPKTNALITSNKVFSALPQDGYIQKADADYLTAWAASVGQVSYDENTNILGGQVFVAPLNYYAIYRDFLFFDTGSIPINANITSATLSLNIESTLLTGANFSVTIQNGQPTYPHNPLQLGDYWQAHYTGNGGSNNTNVITGIGYWNISLTATGRNWIVEGSTTKLCLRSSRDISGTTPTGYEAIYFYAYEMGEGYAAKLYITYSTYEVTYILHGPYYEDGTVAPTNITVIMYQPYASAITNTFNGSDGVADTVIYALEHPAIYMAWNTTTDTNMTRIYYFTNATFDEIWIFIPNPALPSYKYEFTVTDFYGMTNPYLETTTVISGNTRIIERKSLQTVGTVSFILTQWERYGLRFRCDQGLYTQYFDAETTLVTNLQVLEGAFPSVPTGSLVWAFASRFNASIININYSDSRLSTDWLYIAILHKAGGITLTDYSDNLTVTNSYSFAWTSAIPSKDYMVNIQAYSTQLYSWQFTTPAPSTATNPFTGLFEGLGSFPTGFSPELLPAAIIILFVMGIFSYASAGVGCILSWIVAGIMVLIGWYTVALPTFGFAGFVSFLVVLAESKKTEREL